MMGNWSHLIYDQLSARNFTLFSCDSNLRIPSDSHVCFWSTGPIYKNARLHFLSPIHAGCPPKQIRTSHLCLLPSPDLTLRAETSKCRHARLMPSSYQFKQYRATAANSTNTELSQKADGRLLSEDSIHSPESVATKTTRSRNSGDGASCICATADPKPPSEILVGEEGR